MRDSRTIYVDLDDVLGDTSRMFLEALEQYFGKTVDYEELTTFDLEISCSLTPAELLEFFRLIHAPEHLLRIETIPDAKTVLERWVAESYEIAIVTGRPPETYEATIQWLDKEQLPYHSLLLVDKYGRSTLGRTRTLSLDQLKGMSFSMAVEDSSEMACHLAEGMRVPVALRDCPWNRQPTVHSDIHRCSDWQEIDQTFRTICGETYSVKNNE